MGVYGVTSSKAAPVQTKQGISGSLCFNSSSQLLRVHFLLVLANGGSVARFEAAEVEITRVRFFSSVTVDVIRQHSFCVERLPASRMMAVKASNLFVDCLHVPPIARR